MALSKTGPISFGQIADEFKKEKKNFSLSSLYKDDKDRKGNLNIVKNVGQNEKVPFKGKISAGNFFGAENIYAQIQIIKNKESPAVKSRVLLYTVRRYDGWDSKTNTWVWQTHKKYGDVWSDPNDASFTIKVLSSNTTAEFKFNFSGTSTKLKSGGQKTFTKLDGGTVYKYDLYFNDMFKAYNQNIKCNDGGTDTIAII